MDWGLFGIAILFVLFILFYGQMGTETVDRSILFFGGLMLVVFLARSTTIELKYRSPQVVTDLKTYSFNPKDLEDFGDWVALRLGGIACGIESRGREGTVITLKGNVHEVGPNLLVNAKMVPVSAYDLPPQVVKSLEVRGLRPPYFLALEPLGEIRSAEISAYAEQITKMDNIINMLTAMLSKATKTKEDFLEWAGRMGEKKGVMDYIRKLLEPPEEEEQ